MTEDISTYSLKKARQHMPESLDHAQLKAKEDELKADFPKMMSLRVHRSISWIGRAEAAQDDDPDAQFLFLWIAFNAAYADKKGSQASQSEEWPKEHESFGVFFGKVVALDADGRIYNAVWDRFSGPIRMLMDNKYVFKDFWQHHNGSDGYGDWENRFKKSRQDFNRALRNPNSTHTLLRLVFKRLYELRNQLMHGSSTWGGGVNRDQVRDGAAILGFLVPVFVDIMMDNPHEGWGEPLYPVVD